MCFIDYNKDFDGADYEILWVILRDVGLPVHLVLLRRLYTNQEATIRVEFGDTDNIDIGKGVRQALTTACYSTSTQNHNERGF